MELDRLAAEAAGLTKQVVAAVLEKNNLLPSKPRARETWSEAANGARASKLAVQQQVTLVLGVVADRAALSAKKAAKAAVDLINVY